LIHEQAIDPQTKISTINKVRIASQQDDMDIAYLRMSVFSDMNVQPNDIRTQFCTRSCQAIAARRLRGAVCFVATQQQHSQPTLTMPLFCDSVTTTTKPASSSCGNDERNDFTSNELIVGSIECSYHEFFHTRLGQCRKQNALLYITEVAVHPSMRRRGIGTKLLQAIDIYAQQLIVHENIQIETIYLHVDVLNYGAIRMYEQSGYYKVLSDDPIYTEFTSGLNLQPGATRGREHYLLCKNLVEQPIWLLQNQDCNDHILLDNQNTIIHQQQPQRLKQQRYPILGQFGIEIPA
jgi:ribosomal protein S18 acetylase RimI-like enzyme